MNWWDEDAARLREQDLAAQRYRPQDEECCATRRCGRRRKRGEDYCTRCRLQREKAQDDAEGR